MLGTAHADGTGAIIKIASAVATSSVGRRQRVRFKQDRLNHFTATHLRALSG
jgi:hypothetical protein